MGKECVLAVIIVSFGRQERLRAHLRLLAAQSRRPDAVVIVNTGTESVEWARSDFAGAFRVEALSLDNIGPAGAFREGAKHACSIGCDYVIFADDDAHPRPGAIARLIALAGSGVNAAAGYYVSGDPVTTSNHYLMVRRSVLERIGLYYAPFFIMIEDMEFYMRVDADAHVVHDKGIVVDHPSRPVQSFERWRLTTRNLLACAAIPGKGGHGFVPFLRACITLPMRVAFLSAFAADYRFIRAHIHGVIDYALGEHGRPKVPLDGTYEPRPIPRLGMDDVDVAVVRTEDETRAFGKKGVGEEALRRGLGPPGMLRCAAGWAGKRVYMSGSFFFADMSAYLPCALLAKDVFTEDSGRHAHAFCGGALKASVFAAMFLPLAALEIAFAVPLYFISGTAYRRMFANQMEEDSRFFGRAAARASGEWMR